MSEAYAAALDAIYASSQAAKPLTRGRPDREVRDPEIVLGLARRLGLLPPPERTLLVVGSKGKGSTSRLIAAGLQHLRPGEPVGLFISPEEDDYPDRMRIDGVAPDRAAFLALWERLRPEVEAVAAALPPGRYVSPFGTFLLMALAWFRDRGVRHFVLEAGRGARHDEVGRLPARTGVVTSILPEHLDYLGPTLADVADEKLDLAVRVDRLVLGPSAQPHAAGRGLSGLAVSAAVPDGLERAWLGTNRRLAAAALAAHLDAPVDPAILPAGALPAGGEGCFAGIALLWDALIARDSLDDPWLDRLAGEGGLSAVVSLPDDKALEPLVEALRRRGIEPWHVAVRRPRGDIRYDLTRRNHAARLLGEVHDEDLAGAGALLRRVLASDAPRRLWGFGTVSWARLVRKLAIGHSHGGSRPAPEAAP